MNFSEQKDTFKHKGLRKKLVQVLVDKNITNQAVLNAIDTIPRHIYIGESAFDNFAAYEDKAFPIGAGQTISQPYTVAYQTELLELKRGEKVLEIGTGSGYQTTVLCLLGARVFTIERQKSLFDKTKILLEKLDCPARLFFGDGYKGLPAFAPFDKIIVTAGAPFIPQDLVQQLRPGGIMVIPVGDETGQVMTLIRKNVNGELEQQTYNRFAFVPLLANKQE